jgi:electron transfer flavoprotein alpha/beta subunit
VKVFVQVWCEIDPVLHVRVNRTTGAAECDAADSLWRVAPLGRSGVCAALGLQDAIVTAFAIGNEHDMALRHALAAGAHRAVAVSATSGDLDAATLADWLKEQGAELVIADRVAGLIAGRLGWAHLAALDELSAHGATLHAIHHLGRGEREIVSLRLPAAIRVHDGMPVPYIARARLATALAAIERVAVTTAAAPSVEIGPLQPARPRTHVGQPAAPAKASATDRMQALLGLGRPAAVVAPPQKSDQAPATPEALAEQLIRYLAHNGLLP